MIKTVNNYKGIKLEICQIKDLKVGDSFIENIQDKNFIILTINHIFVTKLLHNKLTCITNYGAKICIGKRTNTWVGKIIK